MKIVGLVLSAFCAIMFCLRPSGAAEVEVQPIPNMGISLVIITGEIRFRDDVKFTLKIMDTKKAIVMLDSPGGNLDAALGIGKAIRTHHFATMVGKPLCASGCALAWLAGEHRYATPESKIGFHAAYIGKGKYATETGMGNALIGSYLARLGLSDAVVTYITASAPNEVTWLSVEDANQLGIETVLMKDGELQTTADPVAEPTQNARAAVETFLARMKDAGMFGAVESSRVCYAKLIAKPTKIGFEFCYVFDMAASLFDAEAMAFLKMPPNDYFKLKEVNARSTSAATKSKALAQFVRENRAAWRTMAKVVIGSQK